MTTIAANREMMAADSRVTVADGVSYPATKIVRVKKVIVGACGDGGDCSRFLDWARRDFKEPIPKWKTKADDAMAILALVLKPDGLYAFTQTDPEPEKINADFYAIGTGGQAARVALKLGKTPEEAIALACEVDDLSGPPISVLGLKDKDD